jgi:5'-nucleotidase
MKDITILFDMDGVFVDTIGGFNKRWQERFPDVPYVPYEKVSAFYIDELYPEEHREKVSQIWGSEGFFYGLKPIPGAFEAMEEIKRKVKDVAICTSPYESKYCFGEKWEWVRENMDKDWLKRLIITKDKTRVCGDILIDDKPKITGFRIPSWEHVIYTHPCNVEVNGKRRLTWDNWKEVLTELN